MPNPNIRITATIRCGTPFSSDLDAGNRERTQFVEEAEKAIIEAAMPYVDQLNPTHSDEILDCFDFENAESNDAGFVLPLRSRDCAERLLTAGMLDQTRNEIVARWGLVRPSIPADFEQRIRDAKRRRRGFE